MAMLKVKEILLWITATSLLLTGCEIFEYHPHDGKITGETGINAKNIARIEQACAGKDTIRFAMMGDTQRWYDETEMFVKAVNKRSDIDFVVHGGDISDFGVTKEFMWIRDIMNGLTVPYVALLGNHDCLGTGEDVFREIYGNENFSFMAGKTKFVCLNTNALEYDYSRPVPDLDYIGGLIGENTPNHEKTVALMHAPPFSDQFNNNVARVFQVYLTQLPKLQFCSYAHVHSVKVNDLFDDGIMYYSTSCISDRSYILFTLNPDDTYSYEVVSF